jgi:hypothetical protein
MSSTEYYRGRTAGQLVELRLIVALLEREPDKNKTLEMLEIRLDNMEKGY